MRARFLGALALTWGLGACAGIQVNTDYNPETDFTRYRTFAWVDGSGGDLRVTDDLMHQRFRRAIESELVSRGMEKATAGPPDVLVGYQLALDDRIDYETINTYYGSRWGYRGVYGGVGATQTTAREYTVGTLVIDVYDPRLRELVWRGAGEGKVKQARNPEESQERINQAVTRILRDFPVA